MPQMTPCETAPGKALSSFIISTESSSYYKRKQSHKAKCPMASQNVSIDYSIGM
jgi:hypothetical protein